MLTKGRSGPFPSVRKIFLGSIIEMPSYKWLNDENGTEMVSFMQDLKQKIMQLPLTGSLASAGIGKRLADMVRSKAKELGISTDEAVEYFNSLII